MENIPENPQLSLEILEDISRRFDKDKETIKDFENLDYWVSAVTSDCKHYILDSLVENYVYGYKDYFIQKNYPYMHRNHAIDGSIKGVILGVISSLEKYLKDEI